MESYEMTTRIGKGGQSSVYRTLRRGTPEVFATKRIKKEANEEQLQAARNELALMGNIRHPHIVAYYEHWEDDDYLYIIMELCEGGDLHKLIHSDAVISEEKIWEYFAQIALALGYLHKRNILHRDMKPLNVFLTKSGKVKVGDLGMSKLLPEGVDLASTEVGTPVYYPPEILQQQPYGTKCDIWGLGCILYELTARNRPFSSTERMAPAPLPETFSEELRRLVEQLLQMNPEDRPNIDEVLQHPKVRNVSYQYSLDGQLDLPDDDQPPANLLLSSRNASIATELRSTSVLSDTRGLRKSEELLYEYFQLHINQSGQILDENGERFKFAVTGNAAEDQLRYDHIGQIMELYGFEELQYRLSRKRYLHPNKGTFIFASKGYEESDNLLVLINGGGVVKAGQWSRKLIINDCLESGSQIPYVDTALRYKWRVLIMNPNDNIYLPPVEGCKNPIDHGLFVWRNYIAAKKNIKKIAIVAHSSAGAIVSQIMKANMDDFKRRVYAIALTDASVSCRGAISYINAVTANWVPSRKPLGTEISGRTIKTFSAGTPEHSRTSNSAITEVFKFIKGRFGALSPEGQ